MSGEYTMPEEWLGDCVSMRDAEQPDVWSTINVQTMLGEALLGQKKYAEAEPLLLKSYKGLMARLDSIPAQAKI